LLLVASRSQISETFLAVLAWRGREPVSSTNEGNPSARRDGRITGDAPAGLPEGEIELCLAEPDDDMTDDEAARLNDALARGFESIKAGRFRPAAAVIADLRRR
jgi:hypothetical protein